MAEFPPRAVNLQNEHKVFYIRKEHKANKCPVSEETKASFTNYQGQHLANYQGWLKIYKLITETAHTVSGKTCAMTTRPTR